MGMIWMFIDSTYQLKKHYRDNKGRLIVKCDPLKPLVDGSLLCDLELKPILDIALIAGWLQFMAWTVLGLV